MYLIYESNGHGRPHYGQSASLFVSSSGTVLIATSHIAGNINQINSAQPKLMVGGHIVVTGSNQNLIFQSSGSDINGRRLIIGDHQQDGLQLRTTGSMHLGVEINTYSL